MRENLTEIVFILDRSGSMSGLESDTIGGFNSMLAKQQKEEGEAIVSTVLFDDETDVIHDRVAIGEVKKLTEEDYYVRGCTALLDAVGGAIHHIGNVHKYAREEDRPAKTLFVITTDGLENASRHYSFKDVKRLIKRQQEKYNWEFIFLGANIDAIEVAGNMGISKDRAANYNCDELGTALNYQVLEAAVTRVRKCKAADMAMTFAGGAWKADIDRDYEKRGKKNGKKNGRRVR
ncbi:vWA domain-containing protein [Lachnospira multipara]|uniref:vWA domain-containing protein n=1 Tax=Lachnospira multipara TaxID=28051 RepID=UPI000489A8CA|nr:vWA domain-containing protein [Lachnospira multipara]